MYTCGQVHQVTAQPGPDSQSSSGLAKLTQAVQQLCTRVETIEKAKPADVLQSDVLTKILNRLEQLETPSGGGATSVTEESQRQQWSTNRGKSSKDIVCYRCQKSVHVSRDYLGGQTVSPDKQGGPYIEFIDGLLGDANESEIIVNGVKCPCLVDTGSMVTTLSLDFVKSNLPHIKVESLKNLIKIEGAAGHNIPYVGYMDVTISFKVS